MIKRLEKALLSEIGKLLSRYGFEPKPRGQSFYRRTPFGRWALHVSFVEGEDLEASLDVAVRFDEVEDLVNSHNKLLTVSERRGTYTLGCELGNLSAGRPRRWVIRSGRELGRVAEEMVTFFSEIGVRYLEKYSSPECALDALGSNSREAWLHSPIDLARAKRAIALAFRTGDRKRFDGLVEEMRRYLIEREDPGRASYEAVATELKGSWS